MDNSTTPIEIDTTKIGAFLKSLNDAEYRYMGYCMEILDSINGLIHEFNLDKDFICARFKISVDSYEDFITGTFDYSLREMAILNALFMELKIEALKKQAPIQVPPYKYSEKVASPVFLEKYIKNTVESFQTADKRGFFQSELQELLKEHFPFIQPEAFYEVFDINNSNSGIWINPEEGKTAVPLYWRAAVEDALLKFA